MNIPQFPDVIFCPANIEFLLWCYSRRERHRMFDSDTCKELVRLGVITQMPEHTDGYSVVGVYETTALGRAWVKSLCNVPMPRHAFIDEAGRVIE